ncbi:8426_t:CDS:2, partial [Acaulospora morrowiae]
INRRSNYIKEKMESSNTTSPIKTSTTNVITLSNIASIGWRKYTYTCPSDKLRSFITSAPSVSSFIDTSNFSIVNDPIVTNYIALLDQGIPCTWQYNDESKKNFEIFTENNTIQRELWVFWLGIQGDFPSNLNNLHQLE